MTNYIDRAFAKIALDEYGPVVHLTTYRRRGKRRTRERNGRLSIHQDRLRDLADLIHDFADRLDTRATAEPLGAKTPLEGKPAGASTGSDLSPPEVGTPSRTRAREEDAK